MDWTRQTIDEHGGLGSARPERVGFTVFAWGKTDTEPGGWALWATNPDGDLDIVIVSDTGPWTEEEAKKVADDRLYDEMPMLLASPLNRSVRDVLAERQRQIAKGYDAAHDDGNADGSIAKAASMVIAGSADSNGDWNWNAANTADHILDKHGKDRRRCLIIGIALALAEIERLDRLDLANPRPAPEKQMDGWEKAKDAIKVNAEDIADLEDPGDRRLSGFTVADGYPPAIADGIELAQAEIRRARNRIMAARDRLVELIP